MASCTNQPLVVPIPVAPIGPIASTSYSPTVGVKVIKDYTELMPKISNQTTNLCSTSNISLEVFMVIYVLYCKVVPLQPIIVMNFIFMYQFKHRKSLNI